MNIMKIVLKKFDGLHNITEDKVVGSGSEGLGAIGGSKFYQLHTCYHDEEPRKPCELIKENLPIVERVEVSETIDL